MHTRKVFLPCLHTKLFERFVLSFLVLFFPIFLNSCSVSQESENLSSISVFAFKARHNPQLDNDVFGTINYVARTIDVTLPADINRSNLIAYFSSGDLPVYVHGTVQQSGITPNDFTQPITYEIFTSDGKALRYIITVSYDTRSYNANLDFLSNSGGTLFPRFHPSTNTYTLYQIGQTNFDLFFAPQDNHSTRIVYPFFLTNVSHINVPMSNQSIQIEILAEDTVSEKIYTVNVIPLSYYRSLKITNTLLLLTNDALGKSFLNYCKENHITHLITSADFYQSLGINPVLSASFLNTVSLDLYDYGITEVIFPLANTSSNSWQDIDNLLTNTFTGVKISYLLPPPTAPNQISNWFESTSLWTQKITNARFIPVLNPDIAFLSNLQKFWTNAPLRIGFSPQPNSDQTLDFLFQTSEIWKNYGWNSQEILIWSSVPPEITSNRDPVVFDTWINSISNQIQIWKNNYPNFHIEGLFLGNAPPQKTYFP